MRILFWDLRAEFLFCLNLFVLLSAGGEKGWKIWCLFQKKCLSLYDFSSFVRPVGPTGFDEAAKSAQSC